MWLYELVLYLAFGVPLLVYWKVQDHALWRATLTRQSVDRVPLLERESPVHGP